MSHTATLLLVLILVIVAAVITPATAQAAPPRPTAWTSHVCRIQPGTNRMRDPARCIRYRKNLKAQRTRWKLQKIR